MRYLGSASNEVEEEWGGQAVSSATTGRKAGRPIGTVLTQESIARAAIKRVSSQGYQTLTMPALAKDLSVAASALYNHVSSKQDVLLLMQDAIMSEVDTSALDTAPLDDALTAWARSYKDVFAAHTPLIPLIAVMPIRNAPATLDMYEKVAAAFARDGWDMDAIAPAIVALESFIFGSAFDATAPADIFDLGEESETAPEFSEAVRALNRHRDPAAVAFERGLRALLTGLRASRAEERPAR